MKPIRCQCCNLFVSVGVGSSTLTAASFAYCKRCIQFGAEPEWVIRGALAINGGWKNTAIWVRDLTIPIGPSTYIFADQLLTDDMIEKDIQKLTKELEQYV